MSNFDQYPPIVFYAIADIIIPADRQRQKAEADEMLLESIRTRGLLNPIIIKEDGTLVAGERRLDAHRKLELTHIQARIWEKLTPIIQQEIELHENIARKQLTWQEEARAIHRYHLTRVAEFPGWTQMATSNAIYISQGHLSTILAVAAELEDEEIATCQTLRAAFNLISAKADRARMAAQSRGLNIAGAIPLSLPPALPINATKEERTAALLAHADLTNKVATSISEIDKNIEAIQQGRIAAAALEIAAQQEVVNEFIITGDFLEWAASYSGPKFDVLHVDFPYGKGYSGARTRKTSVPIAPVYADDPDIYFGLVAGLLAVQDRIAFSAAHCLFWFDMQYYQWTIEQFQAAGWTLTQPFPFIWSKGYQGVASDVKRRPRHVYETCLLFSRGDRKIVKLDKDVIDVPVDEKLHLNQKPLAMLKHLLGIYVDEFTAVLDPTCGSGSALAAAAQLGCRRFLGIELDPNNADVARFLLQRHAPSTAEGKTDDPTIDTSNDQRDAE